MDIRDPKNQRIIITLIVMLGIIYFWYTQFFMPTQQESREKKLQYQVISSKLEAVKRKAESLERLKRDYERLLAQYKTVELLLPFRKQTPALLRRLHRAAGQAEVYISEITPQPPWEIDFYSANPYWVKLEGGFHRFGEFLSYIANFPFIVNLSEVKIEAVEDEESPNTIKAELKLTTYNLSQAEGESKEGEEKEESKEGILEKLRLRRKEIESGTSDQKGEEK